MLPRPQLLQRERVGTTLRLQLWLPDHLAVFEGHFPQHPVLPGVIQLAWAVQYAAEEFGFDPGFRQLAGIKFQRVIQPQCRIELALDYAADSRDLSFQYRDEHGAYSSGRLRVGDV